MRIKVYIRIAVVVVEINVSVEIGPRLQVELEHVIHRCQFHASDFARGTAEAHIVGQLFQQGLRVVVALEVAKNNENRGVWFQSVLEIKDLSQ